MRHGQSEANVKGIIVSDPANGVPKFGLTEMGRSQALNAIKAKPIDAHVICCSDFKRARETAEIVREHLVSLGLRPELTRTAMLRERFFGSYEGKSDESYGAIWERDAQGLAPQDNVEPPESVLSRALGVIAKYENDLSGRIILLVAHGDVCQILLSKAAGLPPGKHRSVPNMGTAEIRRLDLTNGE